ncbi:hypothetical protein DICA4_D18294 [Diutina catenulata]
MSASELYTRRTSSGYVASKQYFPTSDEAHWHLKLVKAFDRYKRTIINSEGELPGDIWRVFLVYAARRFVVFMSGCFSEYGQQPGKVDETKNVEIGLKASPQWLRFMSSIVPPLDVAMVWYAACMDSGAWFDRGVRGNFMNFINFPFPLQAIAEAIDDVTFEYNPRQSDIANYMSFITRFTSDDQEQVYHIPSFSVMEPAVFLWCPHCGENLMHDVPWTTPDGIGFADLGFTAQKSRDSRCRCPFSPVITHDELRKRTLYYFIKNHLFLPGVFKHFSETFYGYKKVDNLQGDINKTFARSPLMRNMANMSFAQFVWGVRNQCNPDMASKIDKIMGPMSNTTILFTTGSNTLTFTEDFVQMVKNCEPFFEKICQVDWLNAAQPSLTLDESIRRYKGFMEVAKYSNGKVIFPTVDVDLVWRTHQLAPYFYFQYLRDETKYMFDEAFVPKGYQQVFSETQIQYRSVVGKEYGVCKCNFCVAERHGMLDSLEGAMENMSMNPKGHPEKGGHHGQAGHQGGYEKRGQAPGYEKSGHQAPGYHQGGFDSTLSEKERMKRHYEQQQGDFKPPGGAPPGHSDAPPPSGPPPEFSAPSGPPPDMDSKGGAPPPGPPPEFDAPSGPPPDFDGPPSGPPPEFSAPPGPPPEKDFAPPPGPPPGTESSSSFAPPPGPPPGVSSVRGAPALPPGYANVGGQSGGWLQLSSSYPHKCDVSSPNRCECRGTTGCGGGAPSCRAGKLTLGEEKLSWFHRMRR